MVRYSSPPVGKTKDVGWQIGVRRTLPITHSQAWDLITSPKGIEIWLASDANMELSEGETFELADGTIGEVRVLHPYSHLRMTWHPVDWPRPSTMQIRVIPHNGKTVVAFHQEHLPGPEAREERHAFFTLALDRLKKCMEPGEN